MHANLIAWLLLWAASLESAALQRTEPASHGTVIPGHSNIRYVGYGAGAGLLLIGGLLAWNLALNRLVNRRAAALRESESRLRALLDHIPDWVWLKDGRSRYITANAPYAQAVKSSPEDLPGKSDTDLWPAAEAAHFVAIDQEVLRCGQVKRVTEQVTDERGDTRYYETVKAPVRGTDGISIGTVGIARDVTDRIRAEGALHRMNRTLRMISECDKVLVRASSETELLDAVCRLLVEAGGYRMCWVGLAEQDEARSVRPAAQAGFEEGYLDAVAITWADTERGRGPTGTAIRTGQRIIARHIPTDPTFAPWRQAALQRGYAASATFPLKRGERAFGALMVYSVEPNNFDADEEALLGELADNLAYGITSLRTRAEQERVEEALHRLSAHLLQVQDQERRHLARELHDTTAQHLAALALNLANLKGLLSAAPESALPLCIDSIHLANMAAQDIRTRSYLLHPPLLDVLGLSGAVDEYAQGFSARSGIAVAVDVPHDFGRLPDDLELAFFRVVQESLANVLKHSQSPRARIRFTRQASLVTLEVQDMGRGIPVERLARLQASKGGSGVGIGGMRERLRLLGGHLDLESGPSGTTVRATVPLSEPRTSPTTTT